MRNYTAADYATMTLDELLSEYERLSGQLSELRPFLELTLAEDEYMPRRYPNVYQARKNDCDDL